MPRTNALLEGIRVALMPVASPSDADPNRTWVTLGAGRSAAGGDISGIALPGGGFQVDVASIRAANERAHTGAVPGLLGSRLHALGLTTALIAYQASERPQVPPSAAVIMDESGRIDGGGIHRPAELTPLGKRLDPEQVSAAVDRELGRHDVVLLDLAGLASLANADAVIGRVATTLGRRDQQIYLLTPLSAAFERTDRRAMGPIAVGIPGLDGELGTLWSESTRWLGVVAPADFAPSVLATRPVGAMGHPMGVRKPGRTQLLDRLDRMLSDQFILEGKAARLYVIYMMLLAAATAILGALRKRALGWLAIPALIGLALPIGLLVCPLVGIGQAKQLAAACVVSVALGSLALWRGSAARPLGIVLLIGAALVLADPPLGNPLMRFAPLGFGAITGARFYGIGNEYAGVLGAMAPTGLGLMLNRFPGARWLAAIIGAAVAIAVGAPWWGANWGGCVSIAAGLLAMWVALAPRNRGRRGLLAACGVLVAAALPAALDLLRPEASRSHIGAAASALLSGQLDAVRDTALRKLEMNLRIARLASWWWLLAPVGLLGIWELVRRSKDTWGRAFAGPVRAGILGALVMALVALVANDSGVVMFGMALAATFACCVFLLARSEAVTA